MSDKKRKQKLKPYYSGAQSHEFWKMINSYRGTPKHDGLYTLGCILQNVEGDILRHIELDCEVAELPFPGSIKIFLDNRIKRRYRMNHDPPYR